MGTEPYEQYFQVVTDLLKLHSEVKYFGKNLLAVAELSDHDANEDCLFRLESQTEKTWMVPWLLEAVSSVESALKKMFAVCTSKGIFPMHDS